MGSCDQVSLPSKAMESFKVSVCMCLLVGLSQSAPQNTNEVVRTVTTQLQPLISDAVARALAGLNTVSASSSRFGASSSGIGSSSSFGASSGAAVARGSGLSEEEELEYNRKLSENAAYEYGYKVANDESQTYMAHEETRDGANVQGKYNYVDSTGALVTVTYQAGPEGYTETRDVQEGAVEMRNIPGPWTGPLAGVDNVGVTSVKTTPPRLLLQLLQQDQLLTSLPSSDSSLTNFSPRSAPLFRPPSPAPTLLADKFRECLFPPVALQLLSSLETTLSGSKLLNSTLNTRPLMTEQQPNKI